MDEDLADRLTELRAQPSNCASAASELTLALDDEPAAPEPAALADHIPEIITSGTHNQAKALVAKVTITGPDRLTPVCRIPQPRDDNGAATAQPAETAQREWLARRLLRWATLRPLPTRPYRLGGC